MPIFSGEPEGSQGLERNAKTQLASAAKKKELQEKLNQALYKLRSKLPDSATADIMVQYFEDDEVDYRQYPKYAFYSNTECMSPWFYTLDQLLRWAEIHKGTLCDLFNIKDWLSSQRIRDVTGMLGLESFTQLFFDLCKEIRQGSPDAARYKLKALIHVHQITVEACKEALLQRGSNVYPEENSRYYTDAANHLELIMLEEWEINRGS